ncbi:hypothetical protein GPECTOR_61g839 [Gonium pectorale]|uniref:Uncharacterized protein n=1 Tax=Gonium pectorale TaxID=33097 RepID=A0A150G4S5_GONPE|nr:hypothetical protein GPECTOR_61g839 [Gonium pectorale]|eukprot:KXZ44886.1 hypothetical protein GPECTOR_61g839 [Gonium pectorale]
MEHIFGRAPKGPAPPSRGAVAGVKADMERAKEGFDPKNPNGVGMAWTHNFLNQKVCALVPPVLSEGVAERGA